MALVRFLVIWFVVLTVIYVCLSLYSRSARRAKLESQWNDDGRDGDLRVYVDRGLEEYDQSLKRKLILGVYVVPTLLVLILLYVTNFA